MSETEAVADDTDDASGEESVETETESSSSGGSGLEDFVSSEEQAIITDWAVYVLGMFATIGFAIGLNEFIQDTWNHAIFDVSGGFGGAFGAVYHMAVYYSVLLVGITVLVLLGTQIARTVDNEDKTAFKVAFAVSVVSLPVMWLIAGILYAVPFDSLDLEFVNVLVSGVAAGVAAGVGAVIAVWLTENQSPDGL